LTFIDKRDKGWLYYLYSADENEDHNSTSDADQERYSSKPQSDTTDSVVDMIMGASTGNSANSGEAQQITATYG
jgi:hypothetical protein